MSFPKTYYKEYINSGCSRIGQDTTGLIDYKFNAQGFRCDIDYDENEKQAICFFGSALTSGVGHQWQHAFPKKCVQGMSQNIKAYNFSQGCLPVDNKNIVQHVQKVESMNNFKPLVYIVQFIGLNRVYHEKTMIRTDSSDKQKNIDIFMEAFKTLEKTLENKKWLFFGCDEGNHDLPTHVTKHKNCLIWNPKFIDGILMDLPGPKWHHMMALGLRKKLHTLYKIK